MREGTRGSERDDFSCLLFLDHPRSKEGEGVKAHINIGTEQALASKTAFVQKKQTS